MSSARSAEIQLVEYKIDEFDALFVDSFEQASESRLEVLYDEVAPTLCEQFQLLAAAGEGQVEVLNKVATMLGLDDLDVSKPLSDDASEALVQQIIWRPTARWAVLWLLWALVEHRRQPMAPGEWAAPSRKPRTDSSLPPSDERVALEVAAKSVAISLAATKGAGLVILDLPVVIRVRRDGRIAATPVRPIGLIELSRDRSSALSSDSSSAAIELKPGDRIWLAGPEGRFFSVDAEYEATSPLELEIRASGELKLDTQTSTVGVVDDFVLLYEGNAVEEGA